MNTLTTLRVDMQDGLAVVNLAQAARGNPIDGDFARDFKQLAADLWDAPGLRGADGANYSYGGDLKSFFPMRANLASLVREWTGNLHMGLQRFWQLKVPVVTSVQGFAMGGGVALLAGCDVVLAGESARFGSAFAQIGFSCDSGSSATLTARMGPARAKRFVMLAEVLTSNEAAQCGLADGPTVAYGEIKRLFLRAGTDQLAAQLEDEALTLARVSATADAQEGIAAMVERRKPVFRGR
jgi:2-(1,2-epoxy-1,2-dihydrophenyl)acetyl-CoA isomerase